MREELDRLVNDCQEFVNALYDTLNDVIDKLSDIFVEVYTVYFGANDNGDKNMSEYEYWLVEKKWKESENQKVFESKTNNFKPNKIIKIIQINKRFSPKNWTGKNFKRVV